MVVGHFFWSIWVNLVDVFMDNQIFYVLSMSLQLCVWNKEGKIVDPNERSCQKIPNFCDAGGISEGHSECGMHCVAWAASTVETCGIWWWWWCVCVCVWTHFCGGAWKLSSCYQVYLRCNWGAYICSFCKCANRYECFVQNQCAATNVFLLENNYFSIHSIWVPIVHNNSGVLSARTLKSFSPISTMCNGKQSCEA